jgi:hypothetical protein
MPFSFGSTYMIELQKCFKIDSKYLVIALDHPDSHASINSLIGALTGVEYYLRDKKNSEVAKGVEDFIINNRANNDFNFNSSFLIAGNSKIKIKEEKFEDPVNLEEKFVDPVED